VNIRGNPLGKVDQKGNVGYKTENFKTGKEMDKMLEKFGIESS